MRRVHPAEQASQDAGKGQYAQSVYLDDDCLTPHEAVECDEQRGDKSRYDADRILPIAGDRFQLGDAFHGHPASAASCRQYTAEALRCAGPASTPLKRGVNLKR